MQLRKYLLVDARRIEGLLAIDNDQLVAKFILDDRLHHRDEIIVNRLEILVVTVEKPDAGSSSPLKHLKERNDLGHLLSSRTVARGN